MNKYTHENMENIRISSALMAPFVVLTFQYLILVSPNLKGTFSAERVQLISKLLVAMAFAYALPIVWERSKVRLIRTYFAWTFIFLLHYLVFPENRIYQKELVFPFFFMCLPAFVYSSAVRDRKVLREVMMKASYVVFSVGALLALLVYYGRASVGGYSMPLGYYLLLPSVMFINEFWETASFKNIVLALMSVFIILALGSRGPIMCIGVFILLRLLRPPREFRYAHMIAFLIIAASVVSIVLFFDELLMGMQSSLLKFGFSSRSILLFLGPKAQLDSREMLYREVVARVIDHPFVGIGVAGDRYILGGPYVHNVFLEILANYGVVIGTSIILGLLILLLRSCFCSSRQQYEMFTVWLSIGFIPLLVSGSYLTEMNFWIFIGLITRGFHIGGNLRHEVGKD